MCHCARPGILFGGISYPLIHVNYYTYKIIISYCLTTVWHDYLLSLINLDHYEKL